MNLIRFFITILLLVLSGQALGLFMPDGFKVSTDITGVSNDVDC